MRSNIAILVVASLLAAGCLGVPEDAVGRGDRVLVLFEAVDATTGDVLANGQQAFVAGSGDSGLGRDAENGILGARIGENVVVVSAQDATRSFSQQRTVPRVLDPFPAVQTASAFEFESVVGEQPADGMEFTLTFLGDQWPARVVAVEGQQVQYELMPVDGSTYPIETIGVTLRIIRMGDDIGQELLPNVGQSFVIAPNPQSPAPLGLDPGAYRTVGATEDSIVYEYSTSLYPQLMDRAVEFRFTIVDLQKVGGRQPFPDDGNYGVRQSPQIGGAVAAPSLGGAHDHSTHEH